MMHGSHYYNRIDCRTHFENCNFPLIVPVKFAYRIAGNIDGK